MTNTWRLFKGNQPTQQESRASFPQAPSWRHFSTDAPKSIPYDWQDNEIDAVNAALYLRRPLLVTGPPGCGKSSLLRAVASTLGMQVFVWPINSRSTLKDGLYEYDAIGRLHDAQRRTQMTAQSNHPQQAEDMGDYIRLGPLGSALAESTTDSPKALLIDEFDKSDLDLPNDLLHALDQGTFMIPELKRHAEQQRRAQTDDPSNAEGDKAIQFSIPSNAKNQKCTIPDGVVTCQEFPFIVITSNGERDFPPAFLRRTIRLDIKPPNEERLRRIVACHFSHIQDQNLLQKELSELLEEFVKKRHHDEELATDQLLNILHLFLGQPTPSEDTKKRLRTLCLKALNQ